MTLSLGGGGTTLAKPVRDHLGEHLRGFYDDVVGDQLPKALAKLVQRLERAIQARHEVPDPAFMAALMKFVPHLRRMALARTRNADQADDLVQETILRAWDKRSNFQPDTNLEAWLFTIMRNHFFSDCRKHKWEVEDSDGSHAASQIALPEQVDRLEMQDMSAALAKLPRDQREAILLVGVDGMSYEEAAKVTGVAVGTMKSRVNRARTRLAHLLGLEREDAGAHRLLTD
ncbi:sigma-70 family RNA polymerase sigma factor [Microvirga sp. 0TCS3.31]|jgi:RNA polymerase sigma-70 factor, ECF subfamily